MPKNSELKQLLDLQGKHQKCIRKKDGKTLWIVIAVGSASVVTSTFKEENKSSLKLV